MDSRPTPIGDVRAIIVAWNPGPWIARCVASLHRQGLDDHQIWIVDHGTTDGSLVALRASRPGLNILSHPANRSYGEAINLAAGCCGGQWLLIVNPDTELHENCLRRMLEQLQTDPDAAGVGPRLIDEAGRNVTRYSRTRFHQAVSVLVAPGFFSGWQNRFFRKHKTFGSAIPVTFIEASVMLLRRSAFDSVGGFDEHFTFYGEDADLCWSLRRNGWHLWHVPEALALHAVSKSFEKAPDLHLRSFFDGIVRVAWKRGPGRYRWKRRFLLLTLTLLSAAQRAGGDRRYLMTDALIRRLMDDSWLSSYSPPGPTVVTLTVVVPTFDRPSCLDRLLSLLSEQDDQEFDVVVVVQGAGEGYAELIEHWSQRLRIRRIDLDRPNRGAAKNAGMRSTDADVVLFLDDDLVPGPNLVRTHRRAYRNGECVAMSCRVVEDGQIGNDGEDRLRLTWYGRIVANTSSHRTGPADVAACGNMSFRRRALCSFGGFDPRMRGTANLEEFDVSERLRAEGWSIWFDATTTVRHQPQPGGNVARRRADLVGYVRDLHHNLLLIVRRHRPAWTLPFVLAWCAARSIRSSWATDDRFRSAGRMWWGCVEGIATYQDDQT